MWNAPKTPLAQQIWHLVFWNQSLHEIDQRIILNTAYQTLTPCDFGRDSILCVLYFCKVPSIGLYFSMHLTGLECTVYKKQIKLKKKLYLSGSQLSTLSLTWPPTTPTHGPQRLLLELRQWGNLYTDLYWKNHHLYLFPTSTILGPWNNPLKSPLPFTYIELGRPKSGSICSTTSCPDEQNRPTLVHREVSRFESWWILDLRLTQSLGVQALSQPV